MVFIEDVSGPVEHLSFPGGNHGGVNAESTGRLFSGFIIRDGCQGYLGFKLWTM
jgi:hypothetical protein